LIIVNPVRAEPGQIDDEQITVREAARRLGVKPATLYAYVSRGLLTSTTAPDGRTSRLDAAEVEVLARRGRPRRSSRETGLDLAITTSITEIGDEVRYRGHSQAHLAARHTFEEVAELLWTGHLVEGVRWPQPAIARLGPLRHGELASRMVSALAASSLTDSSRTAEGVAAAGRRLIPAMTLACGPTEGALPRLRLPGRTPISGSVAGFMWRALATGRPPSGALRALNAALVLLADHELAASTLAVRVAASTRAEPRACLLAGLATVSGPLHGAASRHVLRLLRRSADANSEVALDEASTALGLLPGFGHRLYRDGDPRVHVLLPMLREAWPRHRIWIHVDAVIAAARRRGAEPNIDLSLAALVLLADMPDDAGEALFAVARSAGWLAHACEEYTEAPLRFRPRADYVGPSAV
jgi:citrate synthase